MSAYYQPKGCPVHGTVNLSDDDVKLPKLGIDSEKYKAIAEKITDKTVIQPELFTHTNNILGSGIDKVYGTPKYDAPEYMRVQQMKRNLAKFSGYKSAWQTSHLRKAKKENYAAINNSYNTNYLRTEYVHTVRSVRTAKKWQGYQADKDLYPYLEYMPSVSAEPRSEHKKLYGVIKPVDDVFWDTWMPPADWGCKCSVAQRRKNDHATEPPSDIKLPPKTMRNNPGKSGEIITDRHPMIAKLSKADADKIDKEYQYLERKSIRNKVIALSKAFVGKKYKAENAEILITQTGLKKAINQPHNNYLLKTELIKQLPALLKDAQYIKKINPNKGRMSTLRFTHIYKIKNIKEDSYLIVWEYRSGEFTFHSITDKIKEQ
ncbi:MAG: phage minor head protein [Bacteroidota bacterium]|nr:phage minor head protein [Bacteroidota bacterium]